MSAFATQARLVLCQQAVADKGNEITAIPTLLDMLELPGAVVSIDVIGCQKTIVQKIVDSKADYVLALSIGCWMCSSVKTPTAAERITQRAIWR